MKAFIALTTATVLLAACGQSDQQSAEPSNRRPEPKARIATVDVWKDLDRDTFRQRYDQIATLDGADTIAKMKKKGDEIHVTFRDARFQHTVAKLKEFDLANGKFESALRMVLFTNADGKLTQIAVFGDRSDPANLFGFIGAVGVINAMLNPDADEKAKNEFISQLGLMRGGGDPTIGTPRSAFNAGGAFACNAQPSSETTTVGCVVEPRS